MCNNKQYNILYIYLKYIKRQRKNEKKKKYEKHKIYFLKGKFCYENCCVLYIYIYKKKLNVPRGYLISFVCENFLKSNFIQI